MSSPHRWLQSRGPKTRFIVPNEGGGCSDRTTYTVTAKRWEGGWELHIEGVGVTQSRTLVSASQQLADYIATLTDVEIARERIHVRPAAVGSGS